MITKVCTRCNGDKRIRMWGNHYNECPNCVERLVASKKKMAGFTNWFVCPKCGYRERPACSRFVVQNTGTFIDNIKKKNARAANKGTQYD